MDRRSGLKAGGNRFAFFDLVRISTDLIELADY